MDQAGEGESSDVMMAMMAGRSLRRSDRIRRAAQDSELSMSNHPEEVRATNDEEDEDDDVDSVVMPSNNARRGSPSGGHDGVENPPAKRKRLQRLTPQQSQLLEGFFSICAHPDDSQKRQLSETAGLEVQQVKFWFQNKRTQVKHMSGKEENYRLKVENEMLREENRKFKLAQRTTYWPPSIGPPSQNQLLVEVEKLKQHNECLQKEVSRLQGEALLSPNLSFELDASTENFAVRQNDTETIAELAKDAMNELVILAESNGPLWLPVPGGALEVLNKTAYAEAFPGKNVAGFKTEGTRAETVVMMDIKNIVDYLMDSESYKSFCPGILTDAKIIKVYKWPNNEGYDGTMQLMTIESVFPSPLVPSRKCTFVRYCRELQEGTAIVVDVSLDDSDGTFFKCSKMPSGVVIKSLRANSCKVTAIEHVRVDDTGVGQLYQPCLSGLMFGARRWLSSMARQCARMRDVFHVNAKGRKTLVKVADNLLVSYARSITCNTEDGWNVLRGAGAADEIKVAYKRQDGDIGTAIVSVSASFRLPMSLRVTFGLLKNNMLRPKWDVLVNGGVVKEDARVASGVGPDDVVSIVHVKHAGKNNENIMIIQNSYYDVSGAFMVYSPIDNQLMNKIMSPGELSESGLSIYPTGFFLLPDGEAVRSAVGFGDGGGTLVTVGFQILLKLASGNGLYPKSVSAATGLMAENIATIKKTLTNSHSIFYRRSQSPDSMYSTQGRKRGSNAFGGSVRNLS